MAAPQAAMATDLTFSTASEFQSKLAQIIASGTGASTLTYTGGGKVTMEIDGTVSAPGAPTTLVIDLGQQLTIGVNADGTLTIGSGTTLNMGAVGEPTLQLGSSGNEGTLNIDGGTVNINKPGDNAAVVVGYGAGETGTLNITNGGVLNLGTEAGGKYAQFFAGYLGEGDVLLDNGTINLGAKGASIRLGIRGTTEFTMRNGSVLDSSQGASHLWVGDGGTATFNLDNSTLIISGTRTGDDNDRYFFIGSKLGDDSGTGVFNQSGADSLVQVSGIALIGIGQGNGTVGTYNLNGGLLQVGSDTYNDAFRVGVGFDGSENLSTATFNVNGGKADLRGNLEIANAGSGGSRPTATVNLNAGLIDVGGKVVFGSGTGTLNLNGGVLELGGTNAITGTGSIYFAGGTLRAGSDLTAGHAATINTGGATFDSNGYAMTYSGVLSGTGGVTKTGTGTLSLSGANTYGGGTTVSGGTLETRHASALGTGGVTLNGGTLKTNTAVDLSGGLTAGVLGGTIDLASNTITLSGASSGSGAMTFTNGTLTLGAAIGWTGETTIGTSATLATSGDNQLNASGLLNVGSTGTLTNASHSQSVAGLTGSGAINNGGTLTVGGTNGSTSFAGALGGSGTLVKTGTGTLTLTGTGTSTGTVKVSGGRVAMNGSLESAEFLIGAGGTLGGTGTVGSIGTDLSTPGGTIAPGNSIGTVTVDGDVDLDSLTYEVEINSTGDTDLIDAGGIVSLGGGTLDIQAAVGTYSPLVSYKIVAAAGGIDGEFAVVIDNLAFFDASLVYNDYDVMLTLLRNSISFAEAGDTANQIAAAEAIERLGAGHPIYDAIMQLDEDGVRAAFDALSGEIHATARTALIDEARHLRDAANDRLRVPDAGSAIWGQAYGALGLTAGDGNAAGMQHSIGGGVGGVDGTLGDWRVGALAGYSQSAVTVDDRGSSASADSMHFGLYAGTQSDAFNVRTGLSYSLSNIGTERSISFADFSDELSASYGASTLQGFGEIGYTIDTGATAFEPFLNLAHARLSTDGFAETGGDAALTGSAAIVDTTFATLGVRVASDFVVADTPVTARGMVAWRHALGSTPVSTNAFAGEDGFTVTGLPVTADSLAFEAGMDVSLSDAAKLTLSYNGQLATGSSVHSGRAGLAVKF